MSQNSSTSSIDAVIFDLDGTIYRGNELIDGADQFIRRLRDRRVQIFFYTNRAHRSASEIAFKLKGLGIEAAEDHVFSSALVSAAALAGERVYCIGEKALVQALEAEGALICDKDPAAVVLGYKESIHFSELTKAVQHICSGGARFIATNTDPYILVEGKRVPINGAAAAALATATGREPEVYGKPSPFGIDLIRKRFALKRENMLIVGDNPLTDIECGRAAGIHTALTLSGVTDAREAERWDAEYVVKDYDTLWSLLFPS